MVPRTFSSRQEPSQEALGPGEGNTGCDNVPHALPASYLSNWVGGAGGGSTGGQYLLCKTCRLRTDREYHASIGWSVVLWKCSIIEMCRGFRSCFLIQQADQWAGLTLRTGDIKYHDIRSIQETFEETDVAQLPCSKPRF